MAILNYPRHFVLLVGAAAVLALGLTVQPPWSERLFVLFGLSGALHAVAVVLALQAEASWMSRVGFVAAATVLSIAAAGLGLTALLPLNVVITVFVALGLASAVGAVSYWSWCAVCGLRSCRAGASS